MALIVKASHKAFLNLALLFAKVDGGDGETYYWSVDNEEMARVDPIEGFVTVHNGPGEFKVRAAMPDSHHNYGEVKVHKGSRKIIPSLT